MTDTPDDSVERNLQLTGNTTFTISLPKRWAIDQGLEAGDSMHLYPYRDRVVMAPGSLESTDRRAHINASSLDATVVCQRIREAYTSGNDRIEVTDADGLDRQLRRETTRTIDRLVGMAIHVEDREGIVAHDLLDPTDVSLAQSTAQLRQHALESHRQATEAFCTNDETLANGVRNRVSDVDRQISFVTRGFHRGLEDVTEVSRLDADRSSAFHSYQTARTLGAVAAHAERIATASLSQSVPPADDLAATLEAAEADVRAAFQLALSGATEQTITTRASALEAIDDLEQTLTDDGSPGADTFLWGLVLENIRRTAELSTELPHTHTHD